MKVGMIALTAALLMLAAPAWAGPADPCASGPGDGDSDTVCDALDNCPALAHSATCDTDSDGYGNPCDGDFDQDGFTTSTDFSAIFIPDFIAGLDGGTGTDMDCDGFTTSTDFSGLFIPNFVQGVPGP